MCGKFTAMASWREVVAFSRLTDGGGGSDGRGGDGGGAPDRTVTYRPMSTVPVIVFDRDAGKRIVVPMRWGFPHPKNPKIPQPIHARAETIDTTPAFRDAFAQAQRGIVVMQTFNEGKELSPTKTEQWTIDPGDGVARGFAFLWRRFQIADYPAPVLACVMATVPASRLISPITDRMPAILDDEDWATWLGEVPATSDAAKATLRTMEGVNWTMAPEPKKPPPPKPSKSPAPATPGDSNGTLF
jgi:putative SOS response-associated peptidase YedK